VPEGSSGRLAPLRAAKEQVRNALRNAFAIPRRKLYHDGGMTELIRQFYKSISEGAPPPIPYREILLTARLMDEIFAQINHRKAETAAAKSVQSA
jgi:hypothetical protein